MRPSRASNQAPSAVPPPPPIVWYYPSFNGFGGGGGQWRNPTLAYDNNLTTLATVLANGYGGEFQVATEDGLIVNQIRIKASGASPQRDASLKLEAYTAEDEDYVLVTDAATFSRTEETVFVVPFTKHWGTLKVTFLNILTDAGYVNEIQLGYQAPA